MRIRIFRARTLAEAMAQIRSELGPDALILSDRSRDGFVEITAALETDEAPELRLPARSNRASDLRADDIEPFHGAAVARQDGSTLRHETASTAMLNWHGLSGSLIAALGNGPLEQACARTFRFTELQISHSDDPLLLAGPPGAGKTLTTARLATRLVLAGQSPLVITADGRRAGAVEQLAAFTRLLGLTLVAANTPALLTRALERRTSQPVLIDAPGLDLDNAEQAEALRGLLAASNAAIALVLPSGLDPMEAQEIASAHAAFGARSLIATRVDISRRLGGILCAAAAADLALCEAGIGSAAADSLVPLTSAFLAERLRLGGSQVEKSPTTRAATEPASGEFRAKAAASVSHETDRHITHSALPLHIAAQRRSVQLVRARPK